MLEKYCDILVIGNELPGIITAAFLARRGLSVQVMDPDLFSGHSKMPDPVCLNGMHSNFLRSILGRLNVPETNIQSLLGQDSTLQIVFPTKRIDLCNNPLVFIEELEREFSDYFLQIKTFYENQSRLRHRTNPTELFEHLLPSCWKENRALKKFISTQALNEKSIEYKDLMGLDAHLRSFFLAQYRLAHRQICDEPFAYNVASLFNTGDGEIFGVHAGQDILKKLLHDRILHYDGSIRKKVQINKLLYRNGVFEGVELDETHGSVLCKYLIWNDSLDRLHDLLPRKWKFRKLRKICHGSQNDFHWFTVRFTVDPRFLPEPLHDNVIIINEPDGDLIGDNFLYLQTAKDSAANMATLSVNFLLPHSALAEDENFFDTYFDTIKNSLLKLLPFSEKSLTMTFPQKTREMPADTLFPLSENDFEIFRHAAEKNGVLVSHEKSFRNVFKLHYRTPLPNFYIAHPSIFPAFGLDSKLMLGLKITDLIWQEAEKVKKRAMRTERKIA